MTYMLDTNVLIYLMRSRLGVVGERISRIGVDEQLCMSFFTYAEFLKGVQRSDRKDRVLRNLDQLTRHIPVLYTVDQRLCGHYARQFTQLKVAGTPIGANDLWIACHALAEDAILVTHNTREFRRVEGLSVEDWGGN